MVARSLFTHTCTTGIAGRQGFFLFEGQTFDHDAPTHTARGTLAPKLAGVLLFGLRLLEKNPDERPSIPIQPHTKPGKLGKAWLEVKTYCAGES